MDGLQAVTGTTNPTRNADVVFVHGLGGDARTTWMSDKNDPATFWPEWLARDFPDLGVWTLGYTADVSAWKRESMPLADRGASVLEMFYGKGLGKRPLIFITHSLGGLLVKQMLQLADTQGVARYEQILGATRGIAFIATPHAGSDMANFARLASLLLRTSEVVDDLKAHDPQLRTLHGWFLNNFVARRRPVCRSYGERHALRPEVLGIKLPAGMIVVDATSAEPNIPNERGIPLDGDHISVCKPTERNTPLCDSIWAFVEECLQNRP